MIFAALSEAADRGQLLLIHGGLCRWHKRRDGIVVIREVLVLPASRRKGVGRSLVAEVISRNSGHVIQAKCPVAYPSNAFWARMGFTLVEEKNGANRWQRPAHP